MIYFTLWISEFWGFALFGVKNRLKKTGYIQRSRLVILKRTKLGTSECGDEPSSSIKSQGDFLTRSATEVGRNANNPWKSG